LEEVLEISFRTNTDTEDLSRESSIPYEDITDFGYNFHSEFDEESDMEDDFDDDFYLDENEILSFLNEYYTLFIDKLPKPENF